MTAQEMEQRLKKQYPKSEVVVLDTNGDQYHFEVRIQAPELEGLSRVQKHQQVMAVFDKELKSGEIHALTIKPINL